MKVLIMTAMMILMTLSSGWSQGRPKTIDELANYTGPDREKIILEGARKEGELAWYTSLSGKSYKGIAKAFRKKYPEIKLEVYRAGTATPSARRE